mmetsp:Transcript_112232/g.194554  ORF Transcript_112232/g.194554 Transcript_112232/m.194554 type:complete len:232 (-) Transcript_112232:83-778(-)
MKNSTVSTASNSSAHVPAKMRSSHELEPNTALQAVEDLGRRFAGWVQELTENPFQGLKGGCFDHEDEKPKPRKKRIDQRERLMKELFQLQDLDGNGMLEEEELVKLNEKIAMLHYGKEIDKQGVKSKYKDLFRAQLSSDGRPVPYSTFRTYMSHCLQTTDPDDQVAQEMILEQFIAEAQSGRDAFLFNSFMSVSDAPYLAKISSPQPQPPRPQPPSRPARPPSNVARWKGC